MTHEEYLNKGFKCVRVFDSETTGFPPVASMVEMAFTEVYVREWPDLDEQRPDIAIGQTFSWLTQPKHEIALDAMVIHHITQEMCDRDGTDLSHMLDRFNALPTDYWVAHNADFDRKFFSGPAEVPWICTLKAARRIWPNAPRHTNQHLRYWLGLHKHQDPTRTEPSHRAGPDTYCTAFLLAKMLQEGNSLASLVSGEGPQELKIIPFGKHKGTPFKELPLSYLSWLKKNSSDPDVLLTVQKVLKSKSTAFMKTR